jgi:hypothetical protein
MKTLRYGEKVIGAGSSASPPGSTTIQCSAADCHEASVFHADLRGASKRTVEFCAAHMQEARNSDMEFDRQMRELLEPGQSKPSIAG